jgi:hypothetical protein
MKKISLTQKQFALVDDEDYEWLSKWKWCVEKTQTKRRNYYAVRGTERKGKSFFFRMHRVIMKAEKGQIVDHINGNGLDNRKKNLRFCTSYQNSCNQIKTSKGTTSKHKGVCKISKKIRIFRTFYIASINGKVLGRFTTEKEAALAYNVAAKKLHGEFAKLNIIK